MKRPTTLFMAFSLLLATLVFLAPADAQKGNQKKGKPDKPPAGEAETLMVALRWTAGGGVRPDFLNVAGVYVDGEEGARIGFGQSGNLIFTIAPVKGKNKDGRTLTLDFTDLYYLAGDEVRPDFADGPFIRPSTSA